MTVDWTYLLLLGGLWFLFYWIFGGAFFALVSVFRLGRLKKLRFSCLFSLFSLASALAAAWMGMRYAEVSSSECLNISRTNVEGFVGFFGCSLVALTLAFLGGATAVILLGALAMRLSSSRLILPGREQRMSQPKPDPSQNRSPPP